MSQLLTTAVLHTLKHSAACLHPGVPLLKFWGNIIALHCDLCDKFMQTKTFQNARFSKGIAFTAWKPRLKLVESRGAQITGAAISVLHLGVLLSPRVVMVVERGLCRLWLFFFKTELDCLLLCTNYIKFSSFCMVPLLKWTCQVLLLYQK